MREETIHFFSDGLRLDGEIYLPERREAGQQFPAVVLCHGYTGLRHILLPEYAKRFAAAGFVCLNFDYRGFGTSEGKKWRMVAREQVEDIRNALSYLSTRAEVDPHRLGVWGCSYGGAHAPYVAGVDERVKASVGLVGFGDGQQLLMDARSPENQRALLATIEANRKRRVLGEPEEGTTVMDILDTRQIRDFFAEALKTFPEYGSELTWESAEKTLEYKPIDVVDRIAPRALMLMAAEKDDVCRASRYRELYERAGQPKQWVSIDAEHFEVYFDERFEATVSHSIRFFNEHLAQSTQPRKTAAAA